MQRRILILCTGNSCRSQMAEALITHYRGEQWQAFSAGSEPAQRVNPYALQVLAELGIDHSAATPKHLKDFIGQPFDVVVTVCDNAAEQCPFWPGQGARYHVPFEDPSHAVGEAEQVLPIYRHTRDLIQRELLGFLDRLPV